MVERAKDLLRLAPRIISGEIHPVMSLYDCRQAGLYPITLPLMRAFVDKPTALEGKDGLLPVFIAHCFRYADVRKLTGRILVIAAKDTNKAGRLATATGEEFVSMRGKTALDSVPLDEGISASLRSMARRW